VSDTKTGGDAGGPGAGNLQGVESDSEGHFRLPHGTYDTIIKMRRKGRRKEGEKEGFEIFNSRISSLNRRESNTHLKVADGCSVERPN
jgi:hypothetical protein